MGRGGHRYIWYTVGAGQRAHLAVFVKRLWRQGNRVVAFDLPSHNESDPGALAPGRTTAIECANAIAAMIETHGPAHAVVAHSLGANSTVLAATQGAPVGRLVFLAPMASFRSISTCSPHATASAVGSVRACSIVLRNVLVCHCTRRT